MRSGKRLGRNGERAEMMNKIDRDGKPKPVYRNFVEDLEQP
jgi:hypothetical protein